MQVQFSSIFSQEFSVGRVEAGKMVRSVAELCLWWAISKSCNGRLRSLGPIYRSQKMRAWKRCKCSFHRSFRKIFSSIYLTNLLIQTSDESRQGKLWDQSQNFASGGQFSNHALDFCVHLAQCTDPRRSVLGKIKMQVQFSAIFSQDFFVD